MARYKLMSSSAPCSSEWVEVEGQRKTTKKAVEEWVEEGVEGRGLDWRAGFTIKFRDSCYVYRWVWITSGLRL
jgi:hypothetical protein